MARLMYRWAARQCVAALLRFPRLETPFVGIGSRLSRLPGIGRFYRSVAFRFAERLRAEGAPYRRVVIGGAPITVDVAEFTTHDFYFSNRRYEPATTDFLIGALHPGDTCVDIGANHGYYTLIAAARVGPRGRVYAFEPNPVVFDQLTSHIRLNRFEDRVRPANVALADANGEATLFVSRCPTNSGLSSLALTEERLRAGSLSPAHARQVVVETFDAWYAGAKPGPIAVVKIDVEGAEARVVDGMVSTLGSGAIRSIVCETGWHGGIRDRLAAFGYAARMLESGSGFTNVVFTREAA
jgi:FkbM family methyltransferase